MVTWCWIGRTPGSETVGVDAESRVGSYLVNNGRASKVGVGGRGRRALVVVCAVLLGCAGSQSGLPVIDFAPSAKADGSSGKGKRGLLAKRYLRASEGGRLRARNGVELRVPSRVMRRDGFASIRRRSPHTFGIHIAAPWRGTVIVLMPIRRRSTLAVSHRVGGRWVVEPATVVGRRARMRVRSLSMFSTDEVERYARETMSLNYRDFVARKNDFTQQKCKHDEKGVKFGDCNKPWPYDQFNWTTDDCSPDKMPEFFYRTLFEEPCQQHDFGYRNFGNWMRLGRNLWTKAWIDKRFRDEMRRICHDKYSSPWRVFNKNACLAEADLVFGVVGGAAGMTAFYGSERHQFRGIGRPAPQPRAPVQPIPQIEHQPLPTLQPVPVTPKPAPAPPPRSTWPEQQGSLGANTFRNPYNASGMGVKIQPYQWVEVSCKVYAPQIVSANPNGYWYRIASPPWSNAYYAVANTFWNGDIPGHKPYTRFTDWAVPNC